MKYTERLYRERKIEEQAKRIEELEAEVKRLQEIPTAIYHKVPETVFATDWDEEINGYRHCKKCAAKYYDIKLGAIEAVDSD